MTLCLAWKHEGIIYFASDSRLTGDKGKTVVSEDANKIFKIWVQAYGASSESDHEPPLLSQTTYGMCFAGSYLNGSIFADSIEELLSNMQGAPNLSDFSMDNVSDIAFYVYKQVSWKLGEHNGAGGLASIFFGGHCLMTEEFSLFKFSCNVIPGADLQFEKIKIELTEEGPQCIGDPVAIKKVQELMPKLSQTYTYFHILRDIINDPAITTVGGNIQAGEFKHGKFKNMGIAEYSTETDQHGFPRVIDEYKFRGIDLHLNNSEIRKGGINILITLMNPFEHERQEHFRKIIEDLEKET